MIPILLCSVTAVAIIAERLWALRKPRICPRNLVDQIWQWAKTGQMDVSHISGLRANSPLGRILAARLLGWRGTVLGMIKVMSVASTVGIGSPSELAGGLSEALVTTAAGVIVAIPSLMFYRHFQRRIDELVASMEQEALKMVEILHGERDLHVVEGNAA